MRDPLPTHRTDDLDAWEKRCRKKGKKRGAKDSHDYYAMLDLQELRWKATIPEIKEAYKRTSLRCVTTRAARTWIRAQAHASHAR
jgi:hypothetical protein